MAKADDECTKAHWGRVVVLKNYWCVQGRLSSKARRHVDLFLHHIGSIGVTTFINNLLERSEHIEPGTPDNTDNQTGPYLS